MAKIGIYGGTFNPIHLGHINILCGFASKLKLDKTLLIPANLPPHKEAHMLADGNDRMNMCNLAVKNLNINVEVSDIELKLANKSYTAITLKELRKTYPDDEFYLLMGEDMFLTVDKWYHAEEIFQEVVICGAPRSENGFLRLKEKAEVLKKAYSSFRFSVEMIPYLEDSSTNIRELAAKGDYSSLSRLVPEIVVNYIRDNKIYLNGCDSE